MSSHLRRLTRGRNPALLGFALLLVGTGFVVDGELQRRANDEDFWSSQELLSGSQDSLLEAFDIFTETGSEIDGDLGSTDTPSGVSKDSISQEAIAWLRAPSVGLDVATLTYAEYSDLESGVAWMPRSAPLGGRGASVVVGHRTLFGGPFRELDELQLGDSLEIQTRDGSVTTYLVTDLNVRKPNATISDLLQTSGTSRLVLVTCHPEDSTEFRLIIVADVVGLE